MCVAKYGHIKILQLLLKYGAEVDAQDKVNVVGSAQVAFKNCTRTIAQNILP